MSKRKSISTALLTFGLLTLLLVGVYQLFALRFSSGDIYPHGSSLRADPQGTKILYQALAELPHIKTTRQLTPLTHLPGTHSTLFVLSCDSERMLYRNHDEITGFLNKGGRMVLSFRAMAPLRKAKVCTCTDKEQASTNATEKVTLQHSPSKEQKTTAPNSTEASEDTERCPVCKAKMKFKTWGLEFSRFTRSEMKKTEEIEMALSASGPLNVIPWTSARYFSTLSDDWTVLYTFKDQPVIIERAFEGGSVVLLTDSYLFTNEAMVCSRHPELLTHLIGSAEHIIFDEAHLGVTSTEGVMMLIKRYRLVGTLLAFFLLAALFVWKNAVSFIPKYADKTAENGLSAEINSSQGLTNLLQRHIPAKTLIDLMAQEWKSTFAHHGNMQKKTERLEAELQQQQNAEKTAHPVDRYNRITTILNERK